MSAGEEDNVETLPEPTRRRIERLAIVNRGEAAVRCLRTAKSLRALEGGGLEVVALFTAPDRDAPFVRQADRAIELPSAKWGGRGLSRSRRRDRRAQAGGRRRGLARLGLRGRGSGLRRPPRDRGHRLSRPERRGHALARRQDHVEAARREGRRSRDGLERRRARGREGRAPTRRADRLSRRV